MSQITFDNVDSRAAKPTRVQQRLCIGSRCPGYSQWTQERILDTIKGTAKGEVSTGSRYESYLFTVETTGLIHVEQSPSHDAAIYLCGNSLGVQPRITAVRMQQYFTTWATQGVFGHFKPLDGSPLPTWLDADAKASDSIAPIVGALPSEVAVMETLTANLHLLMSAFYKPDINGRHKIIIENQAFPSDHVSSPYLFNIGA